jgi:hypothetical protein
MVYFKALRISGKRPYLGKFCDLSRYEWDSSYVQACIDENLIDLTTVKNGYFRPDDALTNGEFASFAVRGLYMGTRHVNDRDISMELCYKRALELGLVGKGDLPDETITRAECYSSLVRLMELLDNDASSLPADVEIHPVSQ